MAAAMSAGMQPSAMKSAAGMSTTAVPGQRALAQLPLPHAPPRRTLFVHAMHCADSAKGQAPFERRGVGRRIATMEKRTRPLAAIADITPPPIGGDLTEALLDSGAELSPEGIAETFGNDQEALDAAFNSCAVVNTSHFGRLRVSGEDRVRFIHNATTADLKKLKEGQGCLTAFVSPTARTVDLAMAWVMQSSIIITVSPSTREAITNTLNRYIFPADKVEIADITERTNQIALIGPGSDEIARLMGLSSLVGQPPGSHQHFGIEGSPVTAVSGSFIATSGYSMLLSPEASGSVWTELVDRFGAVPMGAKAWERFRILQGRPMPGSELTSDFNPLEAGLWGAISTDKGCYMGQETIARLITYDGVKQQLWGLPLEQFCNPGTVVTNDEGQRVGRVTSCTRGISSPFFALAYVRKQEGAAGNQVMVEGRRVVLEDLAFVQRSLN